jgi:hypothetical protein
MFWLDVLQIGKLPKVVFIHTECRAEVQNSGADCGKAPYHSMISPIPICTYLVVVQVSLDNGLS